ncbi:MAG: hypothetical protein JXQ27_04980 [Acidobacteria bacterium]|nr:hypothetical protein [Acidobacteriota bacterium]
MNRDRHGQSGGWKRRLRLPALFWILMGLVPAVEGQAGHPFLPLARTYVTAEMGAAAESSPPQPSPDRYMLPAEGQFIMALEQLATARDYFPADSPQYLKLDWALRMYGPYGDNNGVVLDFHDNGKSNFIGSVSIRNKKHIFTGGIVAFHVRDISSVSIAHEGIHIRNFARQVEPDRYTSLPFDLFGTYGRFYDELTAYHASALVAEGLGHTELKLSYGAMQVSIWTAEGGYNIEAVIEHLRVPRSQGGYGLEDIPSMEEIRAFIEAGGLY